MNRFKAALFDLDGTLVDTESQYSQFWGQIGREFHPELPHFSDTIKGTTLEHIYHSFFPDESLQEAITIRLDEWEAGMDYPFIAGARAFIDNIKNNGVKCAVVTSSNLKKIDALRKKMPRFDELFEMVLTSEDFTRSKPDPYCYLLAASSFGCDIGECVVFEDAFNGLKAGMSSGIFTVGLATTNPIDSIRSLCDYAVPDFNHLNYELVNNLLNNKK